MFCILVVHKNAYGRKFSGRVFPMWVDTMLEILSCHTRQSIINIHTHVRAPAGVRIVARARGPP